MVLFKQLTYVNKCIKKWIGFILNLMREKLIFYKKNFKLSCICNKN